jgi:hypothetical protein
MRQRPGRSASGVVYTNAHSATLPDGPGFATEVTVRRVDIDEEDPAPALSRTGANAHVICALQRPTAGTPSFHRTVAVIASGRGEEAPQPAASAHATAARIAPRDRRSPNGRTRRPRMC